MHHLKTNIKMQNDTFCSDLFVTMGKPTVKWSSLFSIHLLKLSSKAFWEFCCVAIVKAQLKYCFAMFPAMSVLTGSLFSTCQCSTSKNSQLSLITV